MNSFNWIPLQSIKESLRTGAIRLEQWQPHKLANGHRLLVSGLLLSLGLSALICTLTILHYASPVQQKSQTVTVEVPNGVTSRAISRQLSRAGLIRSSTLFNYWVQWQGISHRLKAGTYQFNRSMSLQQIIDQLQSGQVILRQLAIPEGWTVNQIADLWEQTSFGSAESFLQVAGEVRWQRTYNLPGSALEGYLFPETYRLADGSSAETAIKTMLNHFQDQWTPRMGLAATQIGLSQREAIILASIIEKEAQIDSEREIISSVFHNRLRKGWKLDADPTVLYGLGNPPRSLTRVDLRTDTPYNTYLHKGLPPGPICNPGQASIMAALRPAKTPYFYFVASGGGGHYFSETLDQHQRMVRRYQKSRRSQQIAKTPDSDDY